MVIYINVYMYAKIITIKWHMCFSCSVADINIKGIEKNVPEEYVAVIKSYVEDITAGNFYAK